MNVRARFTDEMARAPFVLSDNEPEADDFTEKFFDAETKSKACGLRSPTCQGCEDLILRYQQEHEARRHRERALTAGLERSRHLSAARDELR